MEKKSVLNIIALEGLIKISSLFIFISIIFLFINLWNPSSCNSSNTNNVSDKLLINLLDSFKFFFCSWLVAQGTKLTAHKRYNDFRDMVVKAGILYIFFLSFVGLFGLMISMVQLTGDKLELFPSSCEKSVAVAVGCTFYAMALCNVVFWSRDDIPDE